MIIATASKSSAMDLPSDLDALHVIKTTQGQTNEVQEDSIVNMNEICAII